MILVKTTHEFSRFYVKTRKENNTYLIHQFIIRNVELNGYFKSESKLSVFRVFWCYDRKLDKDLTAGVFYIRRYSGCYLHDVLF